MSLGSSETRRSRGGMRELLRAVAALRRDAKALLKATEGST